MAVTEQTQGQTVLQHGESVWEYSKNIITGNFDGFKLPDWFITNHAYIVNNLHHVDIMKQYNIYHDCGKPYCLEIDDDGKKHFKNHAEVSKDIWNKISDNDIVGNLISLDMLLHTSTVEQINSINLDKQTAFTLIVTSFAELHSNASMFGGIDSVSFKIKYKKLEKNSRTLFNKFLIIDEHYYSYVIVRNDLTTSQKAVQGTHATIERFRNFSSDKQHPSIIYVVVKNEQKLKSVAKELLDRDINISIFREPMIPSNNSITAICTEPLIGDRRNFLQKFMLM